jgi:hypothetical protein
MGDDEDVLAGGRLAVPAVGQVEQPPSDDHHRRVAVVALHEVGRSLSGPALVVGALEGPGVTSPLPYQSNSGPTSSLSSAMNPSRETTE